MKLHNKTMLSYWGIALAASLVATLFVSKGMFLAFVMLFLLMAGTFWILKRNSLLTKSLALILCMSFLLHFLIIIFIHYTEFRPVGGGADYEGYQVVAELVAQNFSRGNFNVETAHFGHDFPILIGVIYTIFGSDPLVGKFFVVWLFVMAVLLSYSIVIELGGSEKKAFAIGVFVSLYPSYAYFGSLLLKDTLIIPLILAGVLLTMRMTKSFSWPKFIGLFLISVVVSYLRFYVGYALIYAFIISWLLNLKNPIKKNILFGLFFSFILVAFAPFCAGQGIFGADSFTSFLNKDKITLYREVSYNPNPDPEKLKLIPVEDEKTKSIFQKLFPGSGQAIVTSDDEEFSGTGSSFLIETGFSKGPVAFLKNSLLSFTYALLGPFAWQLKYTRQLTSLLEVIPWYVYIITFVYFLIGFIKKEGYKKLRELARKTAPLWTFAIFALGALALFINNYGIIVRIRIPMIICLVIVMSLFIKKEYIYAKHITNRSVEMIKQVFSFLPRS